MLEAWDEENGHALDYRIFTEPQSKTLTSDDDKQYTFANDIPQWSANPRVALWSLSLALPQDTYAYLQVVYLHRVLQTSESSEGVSLHERLELSVKIRHPLWLSIPVASVRSA